MPILIEGRRKDLGGGLEVGRVLPFARRRMVGPFIFLDHMGRDVSSGEGIDVRPHPFPGAATSSRRLQTQRSCAVPAASAAQQAIRHTGRPPTPSIGQTRHQMSHKESARSAAAVIASPIIGSDDSQLFRGTRTGGSHTKTPRPNGKGRTIRSQLRNTCRREICAEQGRTGAPDSAAICATPAAATRRGPRGPSGVIATCLPFFSKVMALRMLVTPPPLDEPRRMCTPKRCRMDPIIVPSR